MPMNSEIKERWLTALRSGEYKQGQGRLRSGDEFCCLGVLCDLAEREGVVRSAARAGGPEFAFEATADRTDGGTYLLPQAVRDWAGLNTANPLVADPDRAPDRASDQATLSELNDGEGSTGKALPFSRIADVIEAHL